MAVIRIMALPPFQAMSGGVRLGLTSPPSYLSDIDLARSCNRPWNASSCQDDAGR